MIRNSLLLLLALLLASVAHAQHKKPVKPHAHVRPDPRYAVYCPAEFPGGKAALDHFIDTMLNYPEAAKEANIQGRVVTRFNIDESGKVADMKILRGIGGGCDEEAKRVIDRMPLWQPATYNNTPVISKYFLFVRFKLE